MKKHYRSSLSASRSKVLQRICQKTKYVMIDGRQYSVVYYQPKDENVPIMENGEAYDAWGMFNIQDRLVMFPSEKREDGSFDVYISTDIANEVMRQVMKKVKETK